MPKTKKKIILFVGGGTMGPVAPLLAVISEARAKNMAWAFFWVGTKAGPERPVVEERGIQFEWLPAAKLRRYFSLRTLLEPLFFVLAWLRGLFILLTVRPRILVSAGGFTSVPLLWAAWLLRKKILIHQQDIRPTLSNKLTAWTAARITVSFERSLKDYKRAEWIGNPVRLELFSGAPETARELFSLDGRRATILVMGGGTGAGAINEWVWKNLRALTAKANLIHITGRGKSDPKRRADGYYQTEFLDKELPHALAAAAIVITRAGISSLSEFSLLGKAIIVVPIPGSHQELNAEYFSENEAAVCIKEPELAAKGLATVDELLSDNLKREKLAKNILKLNKPAAAKRLVEIIEKL